MHAVIQTGGKQYLVRAGKKLKVEKLDAKEGEKLTFDHVLLAFDEKKTEVGTPYLSGAKVEAEVLRQARALKVIVFKYKPKVHSRKKHGHRQPFAEVEITKIAL